MAFVTPFYPYDDPWDWEKKNEWPNRKNSYPWFSQHRNGKYAYYYGDIDYFLTNKRQTHIPIEIKENFEYPGNDIEYISKQPMPDYKTFQPKTMYQLVRQKPKEPGAKQKVYGAKLRWGQYFCMQKYTWMDLQQEIKNYWRSLTIEQRHVWHWMGYVTEHAAKSSGWTWLNVRYRQNKLKGLPPPQWPEMYPILPLYHPEITQIAVYRSASDKATLMYFTKFEIYNYGQLLRTRVYPSVRKIGRGALIDKIKFYGENPEYGMGHYYWCHGTIPQPYEFTCYAVNDWGSRVSGETILIPCHHSMIWIREWWNYYFDIDTMQWCECIPPKVYDYDGSW